MSEYALPKITPDDDRSEKMESNKDASYQPASGSPLQLSTIVPKKKGLKSPCSVKADTSTLDPMPLDPTYTLTVRMKMGLERQK